MTDLIDTTEMYLRTILELEEEGVPPLRARISERLDHSGPTVSQTIGRMERDGLVIVSGDRRLELTKEGREKAIRVMRKHRLAERLLSDIIGLEWEQVHDEACRWEHVMSEQVERKLVKLLGFPDESPYGNPIPGLSELGLDDPQPAAVKPVTEALIEGEWIETQIKRLAEPAQVDSKMLTKLADLGVVPGGVVKFLLNDDWVRVASAESDSELEIPSEFAAFIFIEA